MRVIVVSIGPTESDTVRQACTAAEKQFGAAVLVGDALAIPAAAYDRGRGQHNSYVLMRELARYRRPANAYVLGLTEADLFIPMLTFVFGQAQFEGHVAVASTARLKQEFYGLAAAPALFGERLAKEVAHELGHTLGLVHCPDPACIMSLANNILHVDRKQNAFCRDCRALLDERVSETRNQDEDKLADSRRR